MSIVTTETGKHSKLLLLSICALLHSESVTDVYLKIPI